MTMIFQVACADPDLCEAICQSRAGCTNIAFVKLVTELMPVTIIILKIIGGIGDFGTLGICQSRAGCTGLDVLLDDAHVVETLGCDVSDSAIWGR